MVQSMKELQDRILRMAFPALVLVSIVTSGGLFIVTPVQDREDKLRYLLNFSGLSSSAYFSGIFLADMVLYLIPCISVLLLSYFLNIDTFYKNAGEIFIALFMFGLGFMQLNYLVGFLFTSANAAFKYQIIVMGILYSLKAMSHLLDVFFANRDYFERKHYHEIEMFFLDISPFECLRELMALCLGDPNSELRSNEEPVTREQVYALQTYQFIVLFSLSVLIDYILANKFKGSDKKK